MDVSQECNALLKTSACLVRVIGDTETAIAKQRISEIRQTLNNLETYIQEKEQNNG